MFVGLVALVKRVRADSAYQQFHRGDIIRSRVADGMLGSLMSDDRVAQRLPELEAKLAESLEWVSSRPMSV